jgi:hypothetical protein
MKGILQDTLDRLRGVSLAPMGPRQPVTHFDFGPPINVREMEQAGISNDHTIESAYNRPGTKTQLVIVFQAMIQPIADPCLALDTWAIAHDFRVAKDVVHGFPIEAVKVPQNESFRFQKNHGVSLIKTV